MGGYGSGGHNQTHDYTGRYKKLDSFDFAKYLPLMERLGRETYETILSWPDGGTISVTVSPLWILVEYGVRSGEDKTVVRDTISLDNVPNNYGGADRVYFICPYCGRRSRLLYLHRVHFKCRICAGLNYLSQQITKNEDMTAHKMRKLLRDKFKVSGDLSPYDCCRYRPERPKGMHEKTYNKLKLSLFELREKYNQQFIRAAGRVISG